MALLAFYAGLLIGVALGMVIMALISMVRGQEKSPEVKGNCH